MNNVCCFVMETKRPADDPGDGAYQYVHHDLGASGRSLRLWLWLWLLGLEGTVRMRPLSQELSGGGEGAHAHSGVPVRTEPNTACTILLLVLL